MECLQHHRFHLYDVGAPRLQAFELLQSRVRLEARSAEPSATGSKVCVALETPAAVIRRSAVNVRTRCAGVDTDCGWTIAGAVLHTSRWYNLCLTLQRRIEVVYNFEAQAVSQAIVHPSLAYVIWDIRFTNLHVSLIFNNHSLELRSKNSREGNQREAGLSCVMAHTVSAGHKRGSKAFKKLLQQNSNRTGVQLYTIAGFTEPSKLGRLFEQPIPTTVDLRTPLFNTLSRAPLLYPTDLLLLYKTHWRESCQASTHVQENMFRTNSFCSPSTAYAADIGLTQRGEKYATLLDESTPEADEENVMKVQHALKF